MRLPASICAVALTLSFSVYAGAQVHGIPASATSVSGGRIVGIPASVTSLGPDGFTGPDQEFDQGFRGNFRRDSFHDSGGRLPGRHFNARHLVPVGVAYPVYVFPEEYQSNTDANSEAVKQAVKEAVAQQTQSAEPQKIIVEIRDTRERPTALLSPAPSENAELAEAKKPSKTDSGKSRASAGNAASGSPDLPTEPITLVFRDGHQQEITDYAVMGDSLFDLANGRTKKIPLNTIDLPATRKLNEQRGIEVQLPQIAAPAPPTQAPHLSAAR